MPEELQGGVSEVGATGAATSVGGSGGTAPANSGALVESPAGQTGAGTSGTGGSPANAGTPPVSSPTATPAATPVSLRDVARQHGFGEIERFGDDHQFLNHLLLQAQQTQALQAQLQAQQDYARYGREHYQHRDAFQQFLAAQQQKAQPEKEPWFKAPEYDPAWRAKLERDPQTGQIRAAQGAPPGLVDKYLSAVEHRETFLDKFAFDPLGTIKPGVEEVVRSIAQELVQEQLGRYQADQQARQIVQSNAQWMYDRDGQGQVRYSQQGMPQLSEAGKAYYSYAQQANQLGIQGEQQQHNYAIGMLQRDMALVQLQKLQGQQVAPPVQQAAGQQQISPQDASEAAKNSFLAKAVAGQQHQPQHAGSTNGKGPQNPNLSLQEQLRNNFKQHGVTDEQIRTSINGRGRR